MEHGTNSNHLCLTRYILRQKHVSGVKFIEYNNVDHLKKITSSTAAVICEIIKAEAGIIIGENQYLQQLRNRCNATGTLLIVDEIQTGRRTGTWFAFQQADIIPDILLLGKAFVEDYH
jgi:acetylornithine/succinyldiaminopimelate/putrescine aminotransferase